MSEQHPEPSYPDPTRIPPASVYRACHDPNGTANLSTTVSHALADCLGIDVTESTAFLHDNVDPDALDTLFQPRPNGTPRTGGMLSFFVHDYFVTVYSDGEILIEPPSPDTGADARD
ncbi:HalOD1 output domain-containing protein [Natronobiforma cellulositropha]|uniref:HalOD1 output domain-containing protein n=1 Tax=Natronobiforma cellulositropha TaxID=1679076 RepID=UPI0021D5D8A4|nr:HalOD1 output domain-containing protein [Natronobiforma cellulositropha]